MNKILEQGIKKRSDFLITDLNKYLTDENLIGEYPKLKWFKGSRSRKF